MLKESGTVLWDKKPILYEENLMISHTVIKKIANGLLGLTLTDSDEFGWVCVIFSNKSSSMIGYVNLILWPNDIKCLSS